MPSISPFEMVLTAVYGLVSFGVLVLFLYAMFVLMVRLLHRSQTATTDRQDPAMAKLRDRFARGEIDETEYLQQRAILQGS